MTTVTMTTEVELKKKAGKFNPDDFNFVVASHEIKIKGEERDNIAFVPGIIPPPEISRYMDDSMYEEHYLRYLEEVMKYPIAVLLKAALDNNFNLVFVCTEAEKSMGYLDLFMDYIDGAFEIPTGQFKKLLKGSNEFMVQEQFVDMIKEDLQKVIDEKGEDWKDITFVHSSHKRKKK